MATGLIPSQEPAWYSSTFWALTYPCPDGALGRGEGPGALLLLRGLQAAQGELLPAPRTLIRRRWMYARLMRLWEVCVSAAPAPAIVTHRGAAITAK